LRRARLLITPEENTPPRELIELAEAESRLTMSIAELRGDAATLVLVDPYINALHVTLQRQLRDGGGDAVRQAIDGEMLDRLLREGRESLTRDEFLALLGEPGLCHQAHHNLWRLLNGDLAAEWTRTMASYTPSRRIDLFDGETAANGV
jgi:membrane glycosyltransferase